MLIKNYIFDDNSPDGGKVFIMDGISNIVTHMNSFQGAATNGPRFSGPDMPVLWYDQGGANDQDSTFYFIDFTNNEGVRSRLKVTAYAYICNDEGRTVEKVGASR